MEFMCPLKRELAIPHQSSPIDFISSWNVISHSGLEDRFLTIREVYYIINVYWVKPVCMKIVKQTSDVF